MLRSLFRWTIVKRYLNSTIVCDNGSFFFHVIHTNPNVSAHIAQVNYKLSISRIRSDRVRSVCDLSCCSTLFNDDRINAGKLRALSFVDYIRARAITLTHRNGPAHEWQNRGSRTRVCVTWHDSDYLKDRTCIMDNRNINKCNNKNIQWYFWYSSRGREYNTLDIFTR